MARAYYVLTAEQPVVYTGGEAIISTCYRELHQLAKQLNLPVLSSLMGLSSFHGSYRQASVAGYAQYLRGEYDDVSRRRDFCHGDMLRRSHHQITWRNIARMLRRYIAQEQAVKSRLVLVDVMVDETEHVYSMQIRGSDMDEI